MTGMPGSTVPLSSVRAASARPKALPHVRVSPNKRLDQMVSEFCTQPGHRLGERGKKARASTLVSERTSFRSHRKFQILAHPSPFAQLSGDS
jgi:hypothetical protein